MSRLRQFSSVEMGRLVSKAPTEEQTQHAEQISKRPKAIEKEMMRYSAVSMTCGHDSETFEEAHPLLPLGSTTFLSMHRFWAKTGNYPVILLAGYKAHIADGKIRVGGPQGCRFAYDLKYKPLADASQGGRIIASWKKTTLRAGLRMDLELFQANKSNQAIRQTVQLPMFWVSLQPSEANSVEECPAARHLCLEILRCGSGLGCMQARGGEITIIDRDACSEVGATKDAGGGLRSNRKGVGIAIGWGRKPGNSSADDFVEPEFVQVLPHCAVLHPGVREGATVEPGSSLGDFAPRRAYPNWTSVVSALGQNVADWLMAEAVTSQDYPYGDTILRRVEFCPGSVHDSSKVFEDLSWMVDGKSLKSNIQILGGRSRESLRSNLFNGLIEADFASLPSKWDLKFFS